MGVGEYDIPPPKFWESRKLLAYATCICTSRRFPPSAPHWPMPRPMHWPMQSVYTVPVPRGKNHCLRFLDDDWSSLCAKAESCGLSVTAMLLKAACAWVPGSSGAVHRPQSPQVHMPPGTMHRPMEEGLEKRHMHSSVVLGSQVPKPVKRSKDADPAYYDDLPAPEGFHDA